MVGRPRNPEPTMSLDEIEELMRLTGWSRAELAARLGVSANLVHKWFMPDPQKRTPNAAVCQAMRPMLREARELVFRKLQKALAADQQAPEPSPVN